MRNVEKVLMLAVLGICAGVAGSELTGTQRGTLTRQSLGAQHTAGQAEALIAGGVGAGPGSRAGAQGQLGGAGSADQVVAAGLQSEAGTGAGHGPYEGAGAGRITGNRGGQAGEAEAGGAHCCIGAVLLSGQCVAQVVKLFTATLSPFPSPVTISTRPTSGTR